MGMSASRVGPITRLSWQSPDGCLANVNMLKGIGIMALCLAIRNFVERHWTHGVVLSQMFFMLNGIGIMALCLAIRNFVERHWNHGVMLNHW